MAVIGSVSHHCKTYMVFTPGRLESRRWIEMMFEYDDTMASDLEGAIEGTAIICKVGITQVCGVSSPETISGYVV